MKTNFEFTAPQPVRAEKPIGIHVSDELHDAGLNLADFRVIMHVATRSICEAPYITNPTKMARICRMRRSNVRKAMERLVWRGFIQRTERPGQPTELTVRPGLVEPAYKE